MSYDPETFANFYYRNSELIKNVSAALLKRPNWGFTAKDLNEALGREPNDTAIEGVRRCLRDIKATIEIISQKNPRGPPTKIYKPGKLLDAYAHPILYTGLGKEREGFLDLRIRAAVRCNKPPLECPDSSCKICAANGITTCWDQEPPAV